MNKVDFASEKTQRATWAPIRNVMLNAMVESVALARAALPVDNPRDELIRDGMILDQMHVLLCELVGETEGRILRARPCGPSRTSSRNARKESKPAWYVGPGQRSSEFPGRGGRPCDDR